MRAKKASDRESPTSQPAKASVPVPGAASTIPLPVFAVLLLLWVTLVWFPVAKMNVQFTTTINEGFSTYQQAAVANGEKIYGAPPKFFYQNYPPLSFHLVGLIGNLIHDTNVAGRWISCLAYLAIALLVALIVVRFTGSPPLGAFAALCWLIWLAALDPGRIGYNDPHVLGVAISLAGFYCFLRDPDSNRGLCVSAAVFALSLFTKPTLLAFPAAVAIQLWLSSRRRFAVWLGVSVAACVVLLALTLAIDGRYFVAHQMMPRPYDVWGILESLHPYLSFVQVGFVVAIVWLLRAPVPGQARMAVWAFAIAHALAAVICGGVGAAINHFYDAMICLILILALTVPDLEKLAAGGRFSRRLFATMLILPFFLTSVLAVPGRIYSDFSRYQALPNDEAEFASVKNFVRDREGPALCETLLICQQAGKREEFDPYTADMAFRSGALPLSEIVDLIASRHFRVIQIEWPRNEPMQPAPRIRFPGPVMRALFAAYQPAARTARYALFIPR